MSQNGFMVNLHYLCGGSKHRPDEYYGRKISSAYILNNRLCIGFEDGKKIQIWDAGQTCCESRYITCDDDPQDLIGGVLSNIETKNGGEKENDYETHEMVFIDIITNKGMITLTTHNEHNGYYGGFALTITEPGEDD